ncbi:type IV conjugative transfer system protein TraL (plasmid) [Edwardsiella tarda]|uniref:type IV conjugative transfer system protein TraL n=1 Tax=Edwardsiella tarda TaxID=636 RepID=UPI000D523DFB|nr:type IV conjugative transfer system protein TraL [Edwardsiella tarda]UCQ29557.1 type IV conjugative transfer system protein TraL [Edwardsiella tarda]
MRDEIEARYIFPQTLTEQKRLIGIPLDEAVVGLIPALAGIYYNQGVAGLISGALLWFALTHFKKGKGSSWLYNMCYWHLPGFCFKGMYKVLPDSAWRLWLK